MTVTKAYAAQAHVLQPSKPILSDPGVSVKDGEREFEFTARDFETIVRLIYQRAGITLNPSKTDMVYSRLARRLRALSLRRFQDYLTQLQQDKNSPEWEQFTNSLTTNLTAFFREEHHFPVLAKHLAGIKGRAPRIWCNAASTGEEPYSLAMTVFEALGSAAAQAEILATDLDTNVLRKCESGVYAMERVEKLSTQRLQRFFLRGKGAQDGYVKVRPELKSIVTFRQHNLLDARWSIEGPFDAVFCRNVMIYFDKATQSEILMKTAPLLRPDGLLFVGHSESLTHVSDVFRLRGKTVYEVVARGDRND